MPVGWWGGAVVRPSAPPAATVLIPNDSAPELRYRSLRDRPARLRRCGDSGVTPAAAGPGVEAWATARSGPRTAGVTVDKPRHRSSPKAPAKTALRGRADPSPRYAS